MKRILSNVMPIGTPWGGPESRRYLSSFVSMLMEIEKRGGTEQELRSKHEKLYHLYLVVSGIGVSTVWSINQAPFSHETIADAFLSDYVERTMAYAGLRYAAIGTDALHADGAAVERRIAASIDQGVPVLACSTASEWSIVTGYDDGGRTLIGWDGSTGYWGAPSVKPDRYLENGLFATASWPDSVERMVIVEGRATPNQSTKEVLRHLVEVLTEQRAAGYDREFKALLQDDAWCAAAGEARWRDLWGYVDGYVGWYAENRCFVGCALDEDLSSMPDVQASAEAVDGLKRCAGLMGLTHDTCWEGWRALRATHKCDLPEDAPCRMCGGCLRPPTEEDYAWLRLPGTRGQLMRLLQIVDDNDARMLAELRACVLAL